MYMYYVYTRNFSQENSTTGSHTFCNKINDLFTQLP